MIVVTKVPEELKYSEEAFRELYGALKLAQHWILTNHPRQIQKTFSVSVAMAAALSKAEGH